jgi:peptide-methionine (R)-S-oxide reductase
MSTRVPARPSATVSRRRFLLGTATLGVLAACGSPTATAAGTPTAPGTTGASTPVAPTSSPAETFEVSHTEAEWRQLLTPEQYDVLRGAATERPFTSPLNDEHGAGVFTCAGCDLDLFSSTTKYETGTGWPSFSDVLDNAVLEKPDYTMGMVRTELLCRRCGGHLGHVFPDGPPPTGLRYCMNGLALKFRAS